MSSSTLGASGKDTTAFFSDISHLDSTSLSGPPISSNSTMDEISTHATKRAALLVRNELRAEKRFNEQADVSEDEILSEEEPNFEEEEESAIDDEFTKLQKLSPDGFKVALNFSINRAAEAGFAAASHSVSKHASVSPTKPSATFNRYATVFKVADEISGDEIPRQEIPDSRLYLETCSGSCAPRST